MRKINIEPDKLIEMSDYYNKCKSLAETSLKFNISVRTLKRRLNSAGVNTKLDVNSLRKKKIIYPIDETYFEEIDTSDKAYILGLLYSDGWMCTNRKQIRLKLTDIDLLEKVKEKLNYDKPLTNNTKTKESHKEAKTLIICNGKIYDDLIKLGCYTNKTFNCSLPKLNDIFMGDFIRGFFDGDGCIYNTIKKPNDFCVNFSNNYGILLELKNIFIKKLDISPYIRLRHKDNLNSAMLEFKGSLQIERFYNYIYNNTLFFMKRKHDKFKIPLENAKLYKLTNHLKFTEKL